MKEFRIYHVTRNAAKHNYELDDELYGSPLSKPTHDWALDDPELYIKRVKSELAHVNCALDDMSYILRQKDHQMQYEENPSIPTQEYADAYAFHKFHTRQFEYVEKISHMLQSKSANEISLDIPKALRQFNVLLAARDDLLVTLVRFTAYAESKAQSNDEQAN